MEKNLHWLLDNFIAHKGFFDEANPENSLGAFSRAIEKGYSIEMDIRQLADGTIAVFHDKELSRMTNKDGYITKLNAGDLPEYKLNNTEYSIPTLEEALSLIDGKVGVILDLKNEATHTGSFETKILETIKDYKGNIAITSFNPLTLEWFAKFAPNLPRGLLSTKWTKDLPDRPDSSFKRFVTAHNLLRKRANPDFLSYNLAQLPNSQTKKFKKIPLIGWVANSQEEYLNKVKYVDNIVFEGFEPKI